LTQLKSIFEIVELDGSLKSQLEGTIQALQVALKRSTALVEELDKITNSIIKEEPEDAKSDAGGKKNKKIPFKRTEWLKKKRALERLLNDVRVNRQTLTTLMGGALLNIITYFSSEHRYGLRSKGTTKRC
jgi:uncharacterized protein YbaP (TraB family)